MPASEVEGVDEVPAEEAAADDSTGAADDAVSDSASDTASDSSVLPEPAVPNASNSEMKSHGPLQVALTFT